MGPCSGDVLSPVPWGGSTQAWSSYLLVGVVGFREIAIEVRFSVRSGVCAYFSPRGKALGGTCSSFLGLRVAGREYVLGGGLRSSGSGPKGFRRFGFNESSSLLRFPGTLPVPPGQGDKFRCYEGAFNKTCDDKSIRSLRLVPFSPLFP